MNRFFILALTAGLLSSCSYRTMFWATRSGAKHECWGWMNERPSVRNCIDDKANNMFLGIQYTLTEKGNYSSGNIKGARTKERFFYLEE